MIDIPLRRSFVRLCLATALLVAAATPAAAELEAGGSWIGILMDNSNPIPITVRVLAPGKVTMRFGEIWKCELALTASGAGAGGTIYDAGPGRRGRCVPINKVEISDKGMVKLMQNSSNLGSIALTKGPR